MKTLAAAALTGVLLTLTACGGGADDEKAASAISASIVKSQEGGGAGDMFAMEKPEADCIGTGFVDGIGVEQLQEYGVLTEDLESADSMTSVEMSTEDAESAADTLFECTDVSEMMSQAFAQAGNIDDKTRTCLEEALSDEVLREMFTLMFSGKQDAASQLATQPMTECTSGATQ